MWEGVPWVYFVTVDWAIVEPQDGGVVAASLGEGTLTNGPLTTERLQRWLPDRLFADVVCVWDTTPWPDDSD